MSEKQKRTNKSSSFNLDFVPFPGLDLSVQFDVVVRHPKDLTILPTGVYNKKVVVDLRDLVTVSSEDFENAN